MITNEFIKKQLIKNINEDTINQKYWLERYNYLFPDEKIKLDEIKDEKNGESGYLTDNQMK